MEVEKSKQHVPESFAKRRTRNVKLNERRKKFALNNSTRIKARHEANLKRGEEYHKRVTAQDKELVDLKRKARAEGSFYVPAESKIALVVRIRGINHLPPEVRQILRLFRLRQIHNATFVRINRATLNMLKKVEPYVTYGYPSRKVVSDLIYKRGYGKINKQRIPLTSNELIVKALGQYKINSIEDLINEVMTCGPHFKEANNFIWYFKLNSPKGGFNNKRHSFQQGGDWGNREEEINALVKRML